MKLNLSRFMVLAAAALAFSSAGYAQEVNVRAEVPFNFVLGNKVYPAGEYAIQTLKSSDYSPLYVRGPSEAKSALTTTYACVSSKPAEKTVLVFHRVGATYFLYQVWAEGSAVGRQFPKSHREKLMALNGVRTEKVVVAANVVH